MKYLSAVSVLFVSTMLSGCGTLLAISELDSTNESDMKNPDGLVINRRGQYKVEVSVLTKDNQGNTTPLPQVLKNNSEIVTGVDHDKVIKLDVNRMPFSDGKLSVELNDFQLMKKIELTSKTGAAKAAIAAQTGVDKHQEIRTILKKPEQNNNGGAPK